MKTFATVKSLKRTEDKVNRTKIFQNWMRLNDKTVGGIYRANLEGLPHTYFNISCKFFYSGDLQNIDWDKILKDCNAKDEMNRRVYYI